MAASHQSAWAVPDGIHCPDLEEPSPQGATPLVILAIVPWITSKPEVTELLPVCRQPRSYRTGGRRQKLASKNCTCRFNSESISNQKSVGFRRAGVAKNLALSAH